jgi:hypothetical protein
MSRLENEKKNIIDACKIWVFIMELLFYSPDQSRTQSIKGFYSLNWHVGLTGTRFIKRSEMI